MIGSVLIISGPSGSGKSSLSKYMFEKLDGFYFSVSCTTRPKREGEIDGIHYHFLSKEQFLQKMIDGEFLEWANVYGNLYGTLKKPVLEAIKEGKQIVFDVDVEGHKSLRAEFEEIATSVFIIPPSMSELVKRLKNRNTETEESIKKRLDTALFELERLHKYDYLIVNDDFNKAANELMCIAMAARIKSTRIDKQKFISKWQSL